VFIINIAVVYKDANLELYAYEKEKNGIVFIKIIN